MKSSDPIALTLTHPQDSRREFIERVRAEQEKKAREGSPQRQESPTEPPSTVQGRGIEAPRSSRGKTKRHKNYGRASVTPRDAVRLFMEVTKMTNIPNWWMKGDWFDVCSCNVPCPCTFAQAPTNNRCEGVMAYHIRDGAYGDVPLAGLKVIVIVTFEGNAWARETWSKEKPLSIGIFMEERAGDAQREALQNVFSGQAGGWMAIFGELVGEVRGIEFVSIEFEVAEDLAHWRVDIPGKVKGLAEALSGPTAARGARVQLHNAPGSEVGPGQIVTWGKAVANEVDAFDLHWNWAGQSSKHIPFDWSGPQSA